MVDLGLLAEAVIDGDASGCARLVEDGLRAGLPAPTLLKEGLTAGMAVVGDRFKRDEVFLPDVLVAARAMKAGMAVLRPRLAESGAKSVGRVLMGTVRGDHHDIGKNIVCMMLEGAGFQVVDLGTDVMPERFVEAIRAQDVHIVGLSALLTNTIPAMQVTIDALAASGVREKVKVLVGGAPVTQAFADQIGADGYAANGATAVEKAKELCAAA